MYFLNKLATLKYKKNGSVCQLSCLSVNTSSGPAVVAVILVMVLPHSGFIEIGCLVQAGTRRAGLTGRTILRHRMSFQEKSNILLEPVLIWPEQSKLRPPGFQSLPLLQGRVWLLEVILRAQGVITKTFRCWCLKPTYSAGKGCLNVPLLRKPHQGQREEPLQPWTAEACFEALLCTWLQTLFLTPVEAASFCNYWKARWCPGNRACWNQGFTAVVLIPSKHFWNPQGSSSGWNRCCHPERCYRGWASSQHSCHWPESWFTAVPSPPLPSTLPTQQGGSRDLWEPSYWQTTHFALASFSTHPNLLCFM